MTTASICTIGDEILIGQIVDTNSSHIAEALEDAGVEVRRMVSIGDSREDILRTLSEELTLCDIVITTGGLGPTKDDITKAALAELSGSKAYKTDAVQASIVRDILSSRGLDILPSNLAQADVPEAAEVLPNRLGTAPIMAFRFGAERFGHECSLYSLPGVPHEAVGAIPQIVDDIRKHFTLSDICHRSIMVYGLAESALSELIAPWEDSLEAGIHLAYLPSTLTGVRLRLSVYGGDGPEENERIDRAVDGLKGILGDRIYSLNDDNLEHVVGTILKSSGKTLSVAESCTGGEISHLVTSVPGSSAYYLGSVTSYAISVKENVLGVDPEVIRTKGVVSSEVAAAMAEGVRKLTGSDYAVATTGLAGPDGDGSYPVGTVWIGIAGPRGTRTEMRTYKNDRKRNIERFAAASLDALRRMLLEDLRHDA